MTVTKSLWFKLLCKQAADLYLDEKFGQAGMGRANVNTSSDNLLNALETPAVTGAPVTEPTPAPASGPSESGAMAYDDDGPAPTGEQRSEELAGIAADVDAQLALSAPKPEPKPAPMMAGIPSAALWAAGGVGAAGLLGYLLSRNRRRNRDADAA